MSDKVLERAIWRGVGERLVLECTGVSAELNPTQPQAGLSCLTHNGRTLGGGLFAIESALGELPTPSESYQRGEDFVSTHAASEAHPFRTQLYWSATQLEKAGVVALTLTVSLQTDLLDASPSVVLRSHSGADVSDSGDPSPRGLHRLSTEGDCQLLVAPHPSDASEVFVESDGAELILRLSPPFLEKGVIRRCRFAALLLPTDASDSVAEAALDEYARKPLPLTT